MKLCAIHLLTFSSEWANHIFKFCFHKKKCMINMSQQRWPTASWASLPQSVSRGWEEMILLLYPALVGHTWSTGSRSGLSDTREIKRHRSRLRERTVKVIFSVCACVCLMRTSQAALSSLQGQTKK